MKTLLLTALLSVTLAACEKKDSDKVAEAQDCLDNSASSEALSCLEKIDGVDTEAADLIRCSAHFIYQKFSDPTRLQNISKQMQNSNGAASASSLAIGLLAFSEGGGQRGTMATEAFNYCKASKSKGMLLLASMSLIATNIDLAGGGAIIAACDPANPSYETTCEAAIQGAACDAEPEVLGSAAIAAYQQSCQGSAQQNSSVCAQFQGVAAGQTDNPAAVGQQLQGELQGSGNCPP